MKLYNLAEAAALLSVDPATFRRWRAAAGGVGARGPADRRRVWLSRSELVGLARAHGRVLVACDPGAEVAELAREVVDLRARVAALERVVSHGGYTE